MFNKDFRLILKRGIDILLSTIFLLLLIAPFLIISFAIKLDSRGPIFFRQERIGKDGRPFTIWKFRTMVIGATKKGLGYTVAERDSRITRLGRILRNWGLDELPQLINVLKGEMSIVGPRPTLGYQVEQYDDFQRRRLLMKPGITSWAVIHGRNLIKWRERIEHDVWYTENWSLLRDIKIMLKTIWVVFVTREGIYGPDGTNDEFLQENKEKEGLENEE